MTVKYAFQGYDRQTMARALGVNLEISFRDSVEMSRFIRGMPLAKARRMLIEILEKKRALPLKIHVDSRGHKAKIGPGRYPEKTTQAFLDMMRDLESNAVQQGLSTANLVLVHVIAQTPPTRFHYGRQRRRRHKGCHLEMVVVEMKEQGEKQGAKGKNEGKSGEKSQKSTSQKSKSQNKETKKETKSQPKAEAISQSTEVKSESNQSETKTESKPKAKPRKTEEKKQ